MRSKLRALWLLGMPLAGCASYGRPLPDVAPEINATLYTGPTLIEPGDVVDLRFPRKSEWNQTAGVRPDGNVSLHLLGEVRVAGRSVADLKRTLEDRYRRFFEEPDVTVNLDSPGAAAREPNGGVVISGDVTAPGLVRLSGERLTMIEALGRVGGHLKSTALLGNTLLIRRSPVNGLCQTWRIDAREVYWNAAEPVYLQRHDLIFVPNTPIDDVNTWVDQYINKMVPLGIVSFAAGIIVGGR